MKAIFEKLPPARRAKIEGRARELIGQEMALQQLRPIEPAPWLPPEEPRAEITIGKRRREGK